MIASPLHAAWLIVLAALLLAAGVAPAYSAGSSAARREAIAATRAADRDVRRQAVMRLAAIGEMADAPALLKLLHHDDEVTAKLAEGALWQVWGRSGDVTVDAIMNQGIAAMNRGELDTATELFSVAIKRKPGFAEAWNKRATAWFLMGELKKSRADCDEVIKRNPSHFGALSGYGQIHLRLGDFQRALEYFQRALAINPTLEGMGELIDALRERLESRGERTI